MATKSGHGLRTMNILITGGAGFIGSHLVKHFVKHYPQYVIYNVDKLSYAGCKENVSSVLEANNHHFVQGDITDTAFVSTLFAEHLFEGVIHLAAESHVDRSIAQPQDFVNTNVVGTYHLLEAAKEHRKQHAENFRVFHYVSTDEVYGSLEKDAEPARENTNYAPNSPYAASKAAADHLVRSYAKTYHLPTLTSHCSNNYGPFQHPEKLIPTAIRHLKNHQPVPLYGTGENLRDWLHVQDHVEALDLVFHKGRKGETYNISAQNEHSNLWLCQQVARKVDELLGQKPRMQNKVVRYVEDRPGHDFRYAMSSQKIRSELGWKPCVTLEEGLRSTVRWYLDHQHWIQSALERG